MLTNQHDAFTAPPEDLPPGILRTGYDRYETGPGAVIPLGWSFRIDSGYGDGGWYTVLHSAFRRLRKGLAVRPPCPPGIRRTATGYEVAKLTATVPGGWQVQEFVLPEPNPWYTPSTRLTQGRKVRPPLYPATSRQAAEAPPALPPGVYRDRTLPAGTADPDGAATQDGPPHLWLLPGFPLPDGYEARRKYRADRAGALWVSEGFVNGEPLDKRTVPVRVRKTPPPPPPPVPETERVPLHELRGRFLPDTVRKVIRIHMNSDGDWSVSCYNGGEAPYNWKEYPLTVPADGLVTVLCEDPRV